MLASPHLSGPSASDLPLENGSLGPTQVDADRAMLELNEGRVTPVPESNCLTVPHRLIARAATHEKPARDPRPGLHRRVVGPAQVNAECLLLMLEESSNRNALEVIVPLRMLIEAPFWEYRLILAGADHPLLHALDERCNLCRRNLCHHQPLS